MRPIESSSGRRALALRTVISPFAVRRLLDWYRRGIDVNDRLAALSTYLGHVDVSSTLIYLRPTEATLQEAAKRFQERCPLPIPAERSCDR
jgi:hypothetical protein